MTSGRVLGDGLGRIAWQDFGVCLGATSGTQRTPDDLGWTVGKAAGETPEDR